MWSLCPGVCGVTLLSQRPLMPQQWEDVIEYMLAGAAAVGVGSAQFPHPDIVPQIVSGLEAYVEREKLDSLSVLVGAAHR